MMWLKGSVVCGLACGWTFVAAAQDIAPGTSSDLVSRACSNCHSLDTVTQIRKNRADWDNTVHLMRNYGLEMSDDDMQKIIDYLGAHYGLQAHQPAK
jgi:Quinohemoprotein amine dehydrogenase A, alpha subunit, haem binding